MILCLLIILICFIYLAEICSKRRIKNLVPILVFIVLIILMGGSTQNPDTHIYEDYIYYNDEFFSKDFGFGLLVLLFKNLGFGYYALKMFVSILGFFLINKTLKKYVSDYKLLFILYILYPFFYDVVQVRNFLAMSIFIYAIPFLLENSRKGNVKYIICVLIAATMQKVALVYLPIIFVRNLDKNKFLKFILKIVIVFAIISAICRPLLNSLITFLKIYVANVLEGLDAQLEVTTNWGWIVQWIIQITNFYLVSISKKYINELYLEDENKYQNMKKYIDLIYNINLYMFIFLPLYVLTPTFARIMRNILILNYVCYVFFANLAFEDIDKEKRKKYINLIVMVSITHVIFYIGQYIYSQTGYFIRIIYPILTENLVLDIFKI